MDIFDDSVFLYAYSKKATPGCREGRLGFFMNEMYFRLGSASRKGGRVATSILRNARISVWNKI